MNTTQHDQRPPSLAPGLAPLIARVTGQAPPRDGLLQGEPALSPEAPAPVLALDGVTCMAAVPERPMVPLDLGGIPLVIPRADVTLAFGQGAIGKGRMTWAIIAAVTRAGGDVIVIMPEDKEDEAMAERGRAAGADMARVWNLTKLPGSAMRFKLSAAERHEGHIGHLRGFIETLKEHGRKPRLVVIDPVSAVVGWGTMLQVAGARRLVEPLQDLADETGIAALLIGHSTKAGVLAGSAGLSQALRLVYKVAVDPMNTSYRIISIEKANNVPPGMDGLRFTITEDEAGRARVEWLDKAAIEKQRTAWRADVPAAPAPASPPTSGPRVAPATPARSVGPFAAAWSVRHPGQAPAVHAIQGSWPTLEAAQGICQASARQVLTWQPSSRRADTWIATVYPSGPAGSEVNYAVCMGR